MKAVVYGCCKLGLSEHLSLREVLDTLNWFHTRQASASRFIPQRVHVLVWYIPGP